MTVPWGYSRSIGSYARLDRGIFIYMGFRDVTPMMANQMEENMENEMQAGLVGSLGCRSLGFRV